jgi:hypothetical protein
VFILFVNTFPGCHISVSIVGPAHLQVLLVDFQVLRQDNLFASGSQPSSSFFNGCFFPQCLQIGALLYFLHFSLCFCCFTVSVALSKFAGVLLLFSRISIISFIALVVHFMRASICQVWFLVMVAISSSVASACSSIALALSCFAVSLFCLFSYAYSAEMNVLMFVHVLLVTGLFFQSRTAALNSPDDFK